MGRNENRAAFVTGSSRGIGRAIAMALAAAGFRIALNGRAESEALVDTASEIGKTGVPVCVVAGDISEINNHDRMLEIAENALGPLTTLVNNAGVSVLQRGDLLDVSPESYDRCLSVNARAPFFMSQAFGRRVIARKTKVEAYHSIVNITSVSAIVATVARAEYCVSKAGAAMMSKVFAVRLAEEGVHVFDVQPGLIETDMSRPAVKMYQRLIEEQGLTLLPRLGKPDDIGRIVATLAAGKLPYVTGETIMADAGLSVARL